MRFKLAERKSLQQVYKNERYLVKDILVYHVEFLTRKRGRFYYSKQTKSDTKSVYV